MKKITKKDLKIMFKNIDENFKQLIDYIIFCDVSEKDLIGLEIIDEIENNIKLEKEIDLLIEDLKDRDYIVSPKLLYNTMWYCIANGDDSQAILIDKISKSKYRHEITNYLQSLNKGQSREADVNIQKIIDKVKNKT
jgi:hypothetical protein